MIARTEFMEHYMCFLCINILEEKNNTQRRGSESQWAMIISVLPTRLGVAINNLT